MGQRIVISEQEKNEILTRYNILNESIASAIANKLSGTRLYQLVDKSWDPNPINFVQNILKQIPGLKNKQSELVQKITNITKMDENQKISFINGNRNTVEKEISTTEKSLTEQVVLWYSIAAVVFIYCIIGIVRMEKMRKSDPEKYDKIKNPPPTENEVYQNKLNQLVGKTINLYKDPEQTQLDDTTKIKDLYLLRKDMFGNAPHIELMLPTFRKGIYSEAAHIMVMCKYNPNRFDDRITLRPDMTSNISHQEFYLYNKTFTDKLTELAGQWCQAPEADFGSIPNKNIDPSKLG